MSETLRWFVVEREYEACGGYGCHSHTETDVVAATNEADALRLVDDDDAVLARVAPLDLPDLTRRRNAFRLGLRTETLYRPATWERPSTDPISEEAIDYDDPADHCWDLGFPIEPRCR